MSTVVVFVISCPQHNADSFYERTQLEREMEEGFSGQANDNTRETRSN